MVVYNSAAIYIQTGRTLREKIAKIDAVIAALEDTALKAAGNDNITEYSLDDGQTKISTTYRGADAVLQAMMSFERIRNMYVDRLNGRVVRLVDGKNFIGRRNGF